MTLLLDENAAMGLLFGLVLKGLGVLVAFSLLLGIIMHYIAAPASTKWGHIARVLLAMLVGGFLLLFAIKNSR